MSEAFDADRALDPVAFANGLLRACKSVVLVKAGRAGEERSFACTGIVLTDHYVLAGIHSDSDQGPSMTVHQGSQSRNTQFAGVVRPHARADAPESETYPLMLLRVEDGAEPFGAPISLCMDPVTTGALASIVHHPYAVAEQKLTLGRITQFSANQMLYDAETWPGSSGAPVLDAQGRMIGVCIGSLMEQSGRRLGFGYPFSSIVDALRRTPVWPEFAKLHRIADIDAVAQAIASTPTTRSFTPSRPKQYKAVVPLSIALQWQIDPAALSDDERALVQAEVVDSSAKRWILNGDARARALRHATSLAELRQERGSAAATTTGQRMMDWALKGPPYSLSALDEDSLSHLLQVVRWFEPVEKAIPNATQVYRELERKRARARLEMVAGAGFRGRKKELETLKQWYGSDEARPLLWTGIGGMGKSALVAKFAQSLPENQWLFWLDFDRADIAPDDAISIVNLLMQQAWTQCNTSAENKPLSDEDDWRSAVGKLAAEMRASMQDNGVGDRPLLVLDSFEAAQHTTTYQELWPVLDELCKGIPTLRVLVTGRVEVPDLVIAGRPAEKHHLRGLEDSDARAWLEENGVHDPQTLQKVLHAAHGMPLILQLAARLLQAGGDVQGLEDALSPKAVEALLYERILGRLKDTRLARAARAALVLRRLSPEMVGPVLGEEIEKLYGTGEKLIGALKAEMILLEPGETLRLRSDLRSAVLWLLEQDNRELVRTIDERARDWYAKVEPQTTDVQAEHLYHTLRLDDLNAAAKQWDPALAPYLLDAFEDLPSDAARAFLFAKIKPRMGMQDRELELSTVARIRSALARGRMQLVREILQENPTRSQGSGALVYEAWLERENGHAEQAAALLDGAGYPDTAIGRERIALRALLAAQLGKADEADQWLARMDDPARWTGASASENLALVVRGARLWLTSGVEDELALYDRLVMEPSNTWRETMQSMVSSYDVSLPVLQELALQETGKGNIAEWIAVATTSAQCETMHAALEELCSPARGGHSARRSLLPKALEELGNRLSERSIGRIALASETPFLADAVHAIETDSLPPLLQVSLLGSLSMFASYFRLTMLQLPRGRLDSFLINETFSHISFYPRIPQARCRLLARVLDAHPESGIEKELRRQLEAVPSAGLKATLAGKMMRAVSGVFRPLLAGLIAPDPLETLVHSMLGIENATNAD